VKRCRPEWAAWWRWDGLVVAATDAAGKVTGIQIIALKPDGTAVRRHADDGKAASKLKLSLGKLAGSAVRLRPVPQWWTDHNGGPTLEVADGPLLLGEGFETAASCWGATGFRDMGHARQHRQGGT